MLQTLVLGLLAVAFATAGYLLRGQMTAEQIVKIDSILKKILKKIFRWKPEDGDDL